MTEQSSAASPRAPQIAGGLSLLALVSAAVVQVEPHTEQAEGEKLAAYQDVGGKWTICRGHTGPDVRQGLVATPEQCRSWYRQDMAEHMRDAIRVTPTLVENPSALKAAGDFHFNAGPVWWAKSPMSARFMGRNWSAGCDAFVGYIVLYRTRKIVPGRNCRTVKGVIYCEAPGLVKRRKDERRICLTGI